MLCSIVPGFFDKRDARKAYYESDYAKSYELLYGKKLDNSDTIIYNKSKIILELSRKLDSYHNYMGIGQEVQALDALMSGVQKYPDIMLEAEQFHVTQEVDAIYETILNILSDKYDLSETVAKVIIDYDDLTYTRKLESIVNGTPFIRPEDENNEPAVADILPEEAEIVREPVEELLPHYEGEEEAGAEAADAEAVDETTGSDMEEELPTQMQEEDAGQDNASDSSAASDTAVTEETGNTSDGQLIQGIRQPISIEINGN